MTVLLSEGALRMVRIEKLVRTGEATADTLCWALQCSLATLKRDLRTLREEFGMPLLYDRAGGKTYRLVAPWPGLSEAVQRQMDIA